MARAVETITSNEEHVRLKIHDGDLAAEEATAELLRLERLQHAATRRALVALQSRHRDLLSQLTRIMSKGGR